ncbi:hypothetical protein PT974_01709 [Cladobotryum mycophilum]|uniref:DUF3669 domain-containing protein n=1 Tax=Cladobotryum mycophilum TaxID=491253 RepID=A0ABR0SX55_9HYPO
MAHALAVLHWHTKIDANDIEFVLGSSPSEEQTIRSDIGLDRVTSLAPQTSTYEQITNSTGDFTKRITSLWMIDFDDCEDITMDVAGVDKAVKAFLETNFYCPKPNTEHAHIEGRRKEFSQKYIQHSDKILLDQFGVVDFCHLPRQFIDKIYQQTVSRIQSAQDDQRARRSQRDRVAGTVEVAVGQIKIREQYDDDNGKSSYGNS